jgi:hypothetical protein
MRLLGAWQFGCFKARGHGIRSVWAKHHEPQFRLRIDTSHSHQIMSEQTVQLQWAKPTEVYGAVSSPQPVLHH